MKVIITNKKGEVTVIEKPKTILVKEPKREVITVSANYYDEYAVKAVAESIDGIDTRLEDGRIKMQLPAQPALSPVALTGSYNDLSDIPVLPTYPDKEAMKAEIKKDALKLVDGVYVPTKGFSKLLMENLTGGGDTIVTFDKRSKKVKVTTYVSAVQASGSTGGGAVTNVTGTANRITSTGGATPQIDISSSYVGQSSITTVGTLSSGNATAIVDAASTSAAGKVELADLAETNTGTDATRAVTPDGLAGSYAGTKSVNVVVTAPTANVATGDGKAYVTIPEACNGMDLVRATATVVTAGTTGASTIQIHNVTQAADMLSGVISIASGGTVATAGTIDTGNDDVATNDVLRVDVDSVSTTPPKGLIVVLEFRLP